MLYKSAHVDLWEKWFAMNVPAEVSQKAKYIYNGPTPRTLAGLLRFNAVH
jgi:hypothetical protein